MPSTFGTSPNLRDSRRISGQPDQSSFAKPVKATAISAGFSGLEISPGAKVLPSRGACQRVQGRLRNCPAVFAILQACEAKHGQSIHQRQQDGSCWLEASEFYDLDAQNVTTRFNKIHRYSVKTFDQTSNELNHAWLGTSSQQTHSVIVQKTGEPQTTEGETAEKYLIFGIGRLHGRNQVAGTSLYLLVKNELSDEEGTEIQASLPQA
jgi:hypothetical protein